MASNAKHVALRDRDCSTLLLITKANSLIGNNFQSRKIMDILFFFRNLFEYKFTMKNYLETMRKQIGQKLVCTPSEISFVSEPNCTTGLYHG